MKTLGDVHIELDASFRALFAALLSQFAPRYARLRVLGEGA